MAEHHTWIVDSIDGGSVRVHEDGDRSFTVPRWMLPAALHSGQVLSARRRIDVGGRVTISVAEDHSARDHPVPLADVMHAGPRNA